MRHETLWFNLADVVDLLTHLRFHPPAGAQSELLRVWEQGPLRYLDVNSTEPQLVNPLDPASTQRVYAHGHAHHNGAGISSPAGRDSGHAAMLVAIPAYLNDEVHAVVHDAERLGHDTFTVTVHGPQTSIGSLILPRPQPPGRWIRAEVALSGAPGRYQGLYLDNLTNGGYAHVKLTRHAIAQLRADLSQLDNPPAEVSADALPHPPVIGPDWHYAGPGWPWVCPHLTGSGLLAPYLSLPAGFAPDALPHVGQYTFTTSSKLMWLDSNGDLIHRTVASGLPVHLLGASPVDYLQLPPSQQLQMRAIQHALRSATAATGRTGLAARFNDLEIEELVLTALQLQLGDEALSASQHTLLRRAQAALHEDI